LRYWERKPKRFNNTHGELRTPLGVII
jgi:hypothetical protein